MTDEYKVLGQAAPDAAADTDIYTVPDGRACLSSSLVACNRNAAAAKFRIAVRVAGEALANKQYVAFDEALAGNKATAVRIGMTLSEGDVITVRADTANVSFNLFGAEKVS